MYKIPLNRTVLASIRTCKMSTTAAGPKLHEWLCILPDVPGMHDKRLEVRPLHFAGVKALVDEGFLTWGGELQYPGSGWVLNDGKGAALNDLPADDNDAKTYSFYGSVLTAVAASKEEVIRRLKEDPYSKAGVWDWEKAQIMPYKCAVREPMRKL
jgi:uncharacterized protein YciI